MNIVDGLKQALARVLGEVGINVPPQDIALERPKELSHGDYATGAALRYAKQVGIPPIKLAEKIVAGLGKLSGIQSVEVVAPGFINFRLTPDAINAVLEEVISNVEDWGKNDSQKGARVMVEYTDPNPFKEFHIGHLMSNAIGESISRLVEYAGAEVKRANYQGDVGPHVAKAIWGIKKLGCDVSDASELGRAYSEGAKAYEKDAKAKDEIDVLNERIYDRSDIEINSLYDAGRKVSLEHFEELYKILGTKFDHYFFESETAKKGLVLVKSKEDIFEKSDGAVVFKGEKYGLHTRVFITSKGLPTYETKDLGLLEMKAEAWPFDVCITVTAQEQSEYFQVVQAAMKEVLPELAPKVRHVTHGMMRLASGKMSSRTGDVITGESLLNGLIEKARERAQESRADNHALLAQQIAVAAVKYQILRQSSGKDIIFDRERALSLEGDSGPYLQYAHARAHAVVEKAHSQGLTLGIQKGDTLKPNDVSRLVTRFPEVVERASRELEPHLLTNYLIEISAAFNSWYAKEQILDGSASSPHKVAITDAVRATLKNGLWLLGISAPEKM